MKFLSVLLVGTFLTSCHLRNSTQGSSLSNAEGGVRGEYKGFERINKTIRVRFLDGSDPQSNYFSVGLFLGVGYSTQGLPELLGGFSGEGVANQFRGGKPNAMSVAVWRLAFHNFILDLVDCGDTDNRERERYTIEAGAHVAIHKICAWPDRTAVDDQAMQELWLLVMGFSAPESEFIAWRDLYTRPDSFFAQHEGEDSLRAMLLTIMMSPYFLLNN